MATVSLEDVRKVYRGGVAAVKGVTLHIADGEFVSLVGPSGCGKSTTLNLIAGLEELSGGTLRIDGEVVNGMSPKERDIAMVFQSYALYPHLDVARNLAFPLEVAGLSRADIEARVREVASGLGLEALLSRRPKELSGGQRQRVALGRALVRRPKVFLFDEPLSNLDAALRTQMRGEIKKLHERLQATFIYVTHDQSEAMTLSDRVVVMSQGEVQQVAPPRELYDAPANLFVAGFFGSPRINQVKPGTLGLAAEDVVLGLRPEHLVVTAQGDESPGALTGLVYLVEPMGAESWVTVDVAGEQLVARAPGDFRAASGTPVSLRFDASKLRRFDAKTGRARASE
ncbi:ABC transporter ATP-binding protein [Myxococcus llanfairpwllgwyngyllgogerychwyrndrobwllllantysiliogogogochensis]|uniref:ABC transporter ATP-binding protein n=1 Tax=Myxococcus llanfairpwllgwyngyllgogerychwyrndrobwllllantysiliogogogochensis TaxID=2590453 RepID=A0A540WR64_9BACT|nr:ABC transporter ATP-binding protein [Myxococcus llanfairpwllgwyngyllgogerychwyrndrobwllllantysiliogogogochensis]TQF11473.1 ABC transporter ATP-binding protein [Myxococcus llanfairpwllgwyngyllgogerychwyrndrobwllllantysiliogogogochensis]